MAEVWVRLPLGALYLLGLSVAARPRQRNLRAPIIRMWESLVFRVLRVHEIAGSNPIVLTFLKTIRCGPIGRAAPC